MRAGAARILLALVATAAACADSKATKSDPCLPLPAAQRRSLTANPHGGSLYWLEAIRARDFDSELDIHWKLVRYDVRARRVHDVAVNVGSPLLSQGDDLLALRFDAKGAITRFGRDGTIQALTPSHFDVEDVERINDRDLAFLATGEGPRAVYTLDLNNPRPRHVVDADSLLTSAGGNIFAVAKGEGIAIEPSTGARTSFTPRESYVPLATEQIEVEFDQVLAYSMLDGAMRKVHTEREPWRLVYSPGAILARTAPKDGRSKAVWIKPGTVVPLPPVLGGTSIVGVTELEGQHWALIGHNTANYIGDLADVSPEVDVCLLPSSGSFERATRYIPQRYEAKHRALMAAASRHAPDASLQVFDADNGEPVTLEIHVKDEVGSDLAAMRERVRSLHRGVTSVLGDREIRTRVHFRDKRSAVQRWRRSRLRDRTFVGMGDALMSDPSDVDVELRDLARATKDGKLTCSGTLVNRGTASLEGHVIRCIYGDRNRTIAVPALEPGASFAFDQSYDVDEDATAWVEVYRGSEPVEFLSTKYEAQMERVFTLATKIFADTGLALDTHDPADDEISVTLVSPSTFESVSEADRREAANKAFEGYQALRAIYDVPETTPLSLRIAVQGRPVSYDYDGKTLTTDD